MGEKTRAYIYLSLATFIWGSFFLVSKVVIDVVPSALILCFRYGFGVIVLGIILLFTKRQPIRRKDMPTVILVGFVQYFLSVLVQLIGINHVTSSMAGVISSIAPVFMIVFAVPILKEKIRPVHLTALAITLTGVFINVGDIDGGSQLVGIVMCVMSTVFWAYGSVYTRKLCERYSEIPITFYAMLAAFICSLPLAVFQIDHYDFDMGLITPRIFLLLAYNGIFCTAAAIVFWNLGLARIEAAACSMFVPIQPVVATILGVVLLNEPLNFRFVLGGGLVITGVLYSMIAGNAFRYFERKRRRYLKLQAIRRRRVMRRRFSLQNTQEDLRLMQKHFFKEAEKRRSRSQKRKEKKKNKSHKGWN